MTTPVRDRARIHLAGELAGWELERVGLTDVYRKGTRRVIVAFDVHDRLTAGWRRGGRGPAHHIGWGSVSADRVERLFTKNRWTNYD